MLSRLSKFSLHETYLTHMASCDLHCAFVWKHDFSTMCCTGQHFKTAIKHSALCIFMSKDEVAPIFACGNKFGDQSFKRSCNT